jgi:hypothetical protein
MRRIFPGLRHHLVAAPVACAPVAELVSRRGLERPAASGHRFSRGVPCAWARSSTVERASHSETSFR